MTIVHLGLKVKVIGQGKGQCPARMGMITQ